MNNPARLADLLAHVTLWQSQESVSQPMRCHELVKLFDAPLSYITPVLEMLGWHRVEHRGWANGRRYRRVYWCPKGVTLRRRPRGRPSLLSLLYPTTIA